MREIIPVVDTLYLVDLQAALLHVRKGDLFCLVKRNILHALVVAQGEGDERLVGDSVGPAMIEHHKMSAGLVCHVLEEIVGDVRRVALFGTDSHGEILLMDYLGEQLFLFRAGIAVAEEQLERGADDKLVELFGLAVYGDIDLVVFTLDVGDFGVEQSGMLQVAVDALPDALGAVVPSPQFAGGKELLDGEGIKILENISRRDLVEVAVAEGSERTLPDELCVLAVVELEELGEGHRKILQVRVLALDVSKLHLGRRAGTLITTLGHTSVTVDIVALVLRLEEL